jgi:hypothetical protein
MKVRHQLQQEQQPLLTDPAQKTQYYFLLVVPFPPRILKVALRDPKQESSDPALGFENQRLISKSVFSLQVETFEGVLTYRKGWAEEPKTFWDNNDDREMGYGSGDMVGQLSFGLATAILLILDNNKITYREARRGYN